VITTESLDLTTSSIAELARTDTRISVWSRIAGLSVAVGAGAAIWGLFQFSPTPAALAQLGGYYGLVTALWSLGGLLLIYVAFLGQRRQAILQEEELRLNRLELAATRDELRGQKEQLEGHAKTARKQQFESRFFQLLSLHNEIIRDLRVTIPYPRGKHFEGREAVEQLRTAFNEIASVATPGDMPELVFVRKVYRQLYRTHQYAIGHYFRNLYHVVRYVDRSDEPNKREYTSIVRAQLSSSELALLFYNCLSWPVYTDSDKFTPLLERYALLENMDLRLLARVHHRNLMEPAVFGKDTREEVDEMLNRLAGGDLDETS
jgi:hypothetical protein